MMMMMMMMMMTVLSYGMYLFFSILQNEIIKLDFDFGQLCQ